VVFGQDSHTAKELVNDAIGALGGQSALESVHSRVGSGDVEVLGGFHGSFRIWAKAPNKLKTAWDIGYIRQERSFDGTHGWENNVAVRELVGIELARLERTAIFDPLLRALSQHAQFALKGKEEIPAKDLLSRPPMQPNSTRSANANPESGSQQPVLQSRAAYVIEARYQAGEVETYYFDAETFLPLRIVRTEPYEERQRATTITYGDYRRVDHIQLPFAMSFEVPDLPLKIHLNRYEVNKSLDDTIFANPLAACASDPYEIRLGTIPEHVYKENDGMWSTGWQRFWGIPFPPTESWLFNVTVNEKCGRHLEPTSASLESYSGDNRITSVNYSADALRSMQKFPVARFSPVPEIFDLRYYTSESTLLKIDRLVYKLELKAADGATVETSEDIPLQYYHQKAKLIFPIRGNFMVMNGHEFYELAHKYERSQHYAYDIVGLGPNFELTKTSGTKSGDFYTYATREVLSPADGTVVYARNNDVPDDMQPAQYLRLPDPIYAIAGNVVIIDHGNDEFSLFAHLHQGSVRVSAGERVKQGEVIGLMGSAGSPGLPHLHYQLQSGPGVFSSDGLPSEFENVQWVGWLGSGEPIRTPKRGVYLTAK
jgi:hypothetical protein